MGPTDCTLVLFCKRPEHSKRRLAREIGDTPATAVAGLLLGCALEDLASWHGPAVIAPADPADAGWARGLTTGDVTVLAQDGGNLGERLNRVDGQLRAAGRRRLLYIGADCPTLTGEALAQAARTLDGADVALGAAADGGVVFMGSRRAWPDLAPLPWSTGELAAGLTALCRRSGLSVAASGRWRDVDRASDLVPLMRALAEDARPARGRLHGWLEREGWARKDKPG